jgi:amino acid permease
LRAVSYDNYTYEAISNILKNKLDQYSIPNIEGGKVSLSIKSVPVICTESVPPIIKIFTSFFLHVFKLFHAITFTFDIEDRCVMH